MDCEKFLLNIFSLNSPIFLFFPPPSPDSFQQSINIKVSRWVRAVKEGKRAIVRGKSIGDVIKNVFYDVVRYNAHQNLL